MFSLLFAKSFSIYEWKSFVGVQSEKEYTIENNYTPFGLIIENCDNFIIKCNFPFSGTVDAALIIKNSNVKIEGHNLRIRKVFTDSPIYAENGIFAEDLLLPNEEEYNIGSHFKHFNCEIADLNPPPGNYNCLFFINPIIYISDSNKGLSLQSGDSLVEVTSNKIRITAIEQITVYGSANSNYTIISDENLLLYNNDNKESSAFIETKLENAAKCSYKSGPFIIKENSDVHRVSLQNSGAQSHTERVDFNSLNNANNFPDGTEIIVECPEEFGLKDVPNPEKSLNVFFNNKWTLYQIKDTQTMKLDLKNVLRLTLEFDKNLNYFSSVPIVSKLETIDLTVKGFGKAEKYVDFALSNRVKSVTVKSGNFPFNVKGFESITNEGKEVSYFGNAIIDSNVECKGSFVFNEITITKDMNFTNNDEEARIDSKVLNLNANKIKSDFFLAVKSIYIKSPGKIEFNIYISYETVYINPEISKLDDVTNLENVNVQHALDVNTKQITIGKLANCGENMLLFAPNPPLIEDDESNMTVRKICFDGSLTFFVQKSDNIERNVIYVSHDFYVKLYIIIGVVVTLVIISYGIIIFWRYKRGDLDHLLKDDEKKEEKSEGDDNKKYTIDNDFNSCSSSSSSSSV